MQKLIRAGMILWVFAMIPFSALNAQIIQVGTQYVATGFDSAYLPYDPTLRDADLSDGRSVQIVNPLNDVAGFNIGDQLRISKIGLAGDAARHSGPGGFAITPDANSARFTFGAGQNLAIGQGAFDHFLGTTPQVSGRAHGFVYEDLDILLDVNEGFSLDFIYQYDRDGFYALGTDVLGNNFDDSAFSSTVRGWVQFEVVSGSSVPGPASASILVLGLGLLARRLMARV